MIAFGAGLAIGACIGVLAERADLRADISALAAKAWAKRPWRRG